MNPWFKSWYNLGLNHVLASIAGIRVPFIRTIPQLYLTKTSINYLGSFNQ